MRLSVCLSVCLSQAGIVSRRLHEPRAVEFAAAVSTYPTLSAYFKVIPEFHICLFTRGAILLESAPLLLLLLLFFYTPGSIDPRG